MAEEVNPENLKEGFRVGEYFVSFPPGDFIHEDENGKLFANVDVYKIHKDKAQKINGAITPEVEQAISDELNRILTMAVDEFEKEKDNVQD